MLTSTIAFDIRRLARVSRSPEGLRLEFEGGETALLEASHLRFAKLCRTAEHRAGTANRVGLQLGAEGRILDLVAAHSSAVQLVREVSPGGPFEVRFWAFSPICYLLREHPEFERIRRLLSDSVGTDRLVRFANHGDMIEVESEGEISMYWSLLDARVD